VKASILINNYNYGRYLGQAIESALSQTYPAVEVVVVDDGSTDNSRDVIAGYGNRVHAVLKGNGGQASAFNAGFAACCGDVICLLDSDDYFHPNKVEEIVKAMVANPDAGWVFHPVCRIFTDGRTLTAPSIAGRMVIDNRALALRGRLSGPPGPVTTGMSLSRSLLAKLLPMAEEIRITADNYLKFLASALSPGVYLSEVLSVQRLHGDNLYTMGRDRILEVHIHLLIADAMRRQQPALGRLSNHIFARSLAMYATASRRDARCENIIKSFLRATAISDMPDLVLRALYHGMRRRLAGWTLRGVAAGDVP
jgi:glycosyltransferase involved in cell wall biosynthesis